MKKHLIILVLMLLPSVYSVAAGVIRVCSTSADSIFVDGIFAGFAPLKVHVPFGVHTIQCYNQTIKTLVESENIEPLLTFLPLKWSTDATEEQKKAISRILIDMETLPEGFVQYNTLKQYFPKSDSRLRDTVRIEGKLCVKTPKVRISRFLTSWEDWETILGRTKKKDPLYDDPDFLLDAVKLVSDKNLIHRYLQKLHDLCGLEFSLPDSLVLLSIDNYFPTRELKDKHNEARKKMYNFWYHSRGYDNRLSRRICINNYVGEYTASSGSFHFRNDLKNTTFYKNGAFRVVVKLPEMPDDVPLIDLNQQISHLHQIKKQKEKKQFEEWLVQAKAGNTASMSMLGVAYHLGLGTEIDNIKAIDWDIKAAMAGDNTGLAHLAYYSKYAISPRIRERAASQIYENLAAKGNMRALGELANCYLIGFGVTQSEKTAREIAQIAADNGNTHGEYMLAKCWQNQSESKENTNEALKLYLKSISHDNPENIRPDSYYEIGKIMKNLGEYEVATNYFSTAYRHNIPEAYLELAQSLRNGIGCEVNEESAAAICYEYYKNHLASFHNKAEAAYQIARYYLNDPHKDPNLQLKWYTIAADLGHTKAQYETGLCYLKQNKDVETALYYFQLAAENGHTEAMERLAKYYRTKEKDEETALYWEEKAGKTLQNEGMKKEQLDQTYKQLFHWEGCEEYMISENPKKIKDKYGVSVEACISMFCYTWEKPNELLSDISFLNLKKWTDVFDSQADHNSASYPEMCRFIGETYTRILPYESKKAHSLAKKDLLKRDVAWWWNYCLKEDAVNIQQCLSLALIYFNEALNSYKKRNDTSNENYLMGLLQKADALYYIGKHKSCIEHLNECIEGIRKALIASITDKSVEEQKAFCEKWGNWLSLVIPNYYTTDKQFAAQYAILAYNSALLYKGMQTNLEKKSITEKQRIKNIQANWKIIQNKLRKGEVSIELIRTYHPIMQAIYYRAVVVKPGITPVYIELDSENNFEEYFKYGLTYISELTYEVFWKRIEPYINDCHTIYYSPDGIFQLMQMEAVPYDGNTYVDEKWNIYRLTSTRELLTNRLPDQLNSALLVGGLEYGQTTSSHVRGMINNLPESLEEVNAIGSMMQEKGKTVRILSGSAGNEAVLRASIANHDVVHIASHGYYWNDNQVRMNKRMKFMANATPNNLPMLTSGLMVSGVNQTIANKWTDTDVDNDGIVTSAEISEMDLSAAKLVVLSACQSGIGLVSGEGINGLQRGLKIAGAQSLMLSLWKIDDRATRLFMEEFYKHLLAGSTKQDALKAARQFLRNYHEIALDNGKIKLYPYDNPIYWGGFVLIDAIN